MTETSLDMEERQRIEIRVKMPILDERQANFREIED